ncbi:hypothetical protein LCGC14_2395340, partial [marine sediment metagenome]
VGRFMSEKLDGRRAFWDGGISRGIPASRVPFANTLKDYKKRTPPVATGLWSRFGNVISAPNWFLDQLPSFPLDGEMLDGVSRQTTISITSKDIPIDKEWKKILYYIFESPPLHKVFSSIPYRATAKDVVEIDSVAMDLFIHKQVEELVETNTKHFEWAFQPKSFSEIVVHQDGWNLFELDKIPFRKLLFLSQTEIKSLDHMYEELAKTRANGGEGLMLRRPDSFYECKRSHNLLKLKNISFGEAEVIGYHTGRETDRGSKLLGLMGNVIVSWENIHFELSGFTDAERKLIGSGFNGREWALQNPDTYCPVGISSPTFPRGSKIKFTYRGLTNDGIPNEARYRRTQ